MGEDQDWVDTEEFLTDTDRKRRILTRKDRKYLTGEKSVKQSSIYMTEKRIRERIAGGVRDLSFLIETGNEDFLEADSKYPPHTGQALVSHFLEASLHYFRDYVLNRSTNTDNPLTSVELIPHLEDRLENVLPKVLTDFPFASIDDVNVEINVEGTLKKKELLEEKMLDAQYVKRHEYEAWKDMGGQKDQLKSRVCEENEKVVIKDPEAGDIIIAPDES